MSTKLQTFCVVAFTCKSTRTVLLAGLIPNIRDNNISLKQGTSDQACSGVQSGFHMLQDLELTLTSQKWLTSSHCIKWQEQLIYFHFDHTAGICNESWRCCSEQNSGQDTLGYDSYDWIRHPFQRAIFFFTSDRVSEETWQNLGATPRTAPVASGSEMSSLQANKKSVGNLLVVSSTCSCITLRRY